MKVYRVCRINEVNNILNSKDFNLIYNINKNGSQNTHKYKEGVSYLHFFDKIENLLYLDLYNNYYISIYDIPYELLSLYKGKGIYYDFISFKSIVKIDEYAIPTYELNFDYLKEIYKITKTLDTEDFFDEEYKDYLEKVYGEYKYEKKLY